MQFLVYDPNWDPTKAQEAPPPEMLAEIGRFTMEAIQAGVVVATGALEPKSKRIKRDGGKYSVTDGPFIEVKELLGGFAIIRAKSLEEAVEWTKRFRAIIGDGESEVVRVFGPEDFGQ